MRRAARIMNHEIAFFGELLIRLSPPGRRRMLQSEELQMYLAGSELNVAAGMAQWEVAPLFISAVPQNMLGQWVLQQMHRRGVRTEGVVFKEGRQGLFLLEEGQGIRPSSVQYDRHHTALCAARPGDWNWQQLFQGKTHFHFSGITPAIDPATAALTLHAVSEAEEAGCFISCDLNYRSKLWQYGTAPQVVMPALAEKASLLLCGPDAIEKMLGISLTDMGYKERALQPSQLEPVRQRLFERFPRLQYWAMSLRNSLSATDYDWQGYLCSREEAVSSRSFALRNCMDRVGTGDAFMAGLLKGFLGGWPLQQTIDFAAAAGAFKHYIAGDILMASEAELVALAQTDEIKISR